MTGWEPLGNVCSKTSAKVEATPYKAIEPNPGNGVFLGTWGKHYFTPGNLLRRAQCRWNQWSEDWSSFDYIKFYGATIWIIPNQINPWMITFDPYFQYAKQQLVDEKNKEDLWGHPGVLLHNPHTHMILPSNQFPRKKLYKIKIKPPPGWKGYQRFPDAFSYILFHWLWTTFNPYTSFMDLTQHVQDACTQNPWWAVQNKCAKWVNRSKYKDPTNSQETWGPFLPTRPEEHSGDFSVWFKYRLYFKLAGDSLWRPLPTNVLTEGMVPEPPGPDQVSSKTRTHHSKKRRRRPQHEADIWPGDLDSHGLLTDTAYQRIVDHHPEPKRRKLVPYTSKFLISKLSDIVNKYGKF